jgi:cell division protein ZapA
MRKPIEVHIMGQTFAVTSDDDDQHVREVAAFVDGEIRKMTVGGRNVPPVSAAVLAALNIASEYHKLKQQQEKIEEIIDRLSARLADPGSGLGAKER